MRETITEESVTSKGNRKIVFNELLFQKIKLDIIISLIVLIVRRAAIFKAIDINHHELEVL